MIKPSAKSRLWVSGIFALTIVSLGSGWRIAYSQTTPNAVSQPASDVTSRKPAPTDPVNLAPQNPRMAVATSNPTPEDICKEIKELPKRTSDEIIACIQDRTNSNRVQCMDQGLCSASRMARGAVINAFFYNISSLDFQVSVAPGDERSLQELTKLGPFSMREIKWDKSEKSFSTVARYKLWTGQILGDQLTVSLPNTYKIEEKNKQGEVTAINKEVDCVVSIQLNNERSAMEGTASCQGINVIFKARLGFGG
jgi:hypothetical protein